MWVGLAHGVRLRFFSFCDKAASSPAGRGQQPTDRAIWEVSATVDLCLVIRGHACSVGVMCALCVTYVIAGWCLLFYQLPSAERSDGDVGRERWPWDIVCGAFDVELRHGRFGLGLRRGALDVGAWTWKLGRGASDVKAWTWELRRGSVLRRRGSNTERLAVCQVSRQGKFVLFCIVL